MTAKKTKNSDETYGSLRAQLDEVLLKLQDPDCDVDEAVDLYEQALRLVNKLEARLQTAENRVQKIKADLS
jgi:exodeoxyribonuclease VII small subunit